MLPEAAGGLGSRPAAWHPPIARDDAALARALRAPCGLGCRDRSCFQPRDCPGSRASEFRLCLVRARPTGAVSLSYSSPAPPSPVTRSSAPPATSFVAPPDRRLMLRLAWPAPARPAGVSSSVSRHHRRPRLRDPSHPARRRRRFRPLRRRSARRPARSTRRA